MAFPCSIKSSVVCSIRGDNIVPTLTPVAIVRTKEKIKNCKTRLCLIHLIITFTSTERNRAIPEDTMLEARVHLEHHEYYSHEQAIV